jgi:hypothetical protein
MSRFAYLEYQGTFPPTIYSSYREPYHFVVKVERDEADKHERTAEELKRVAGILILNKLGPRTAEVLREGAPPQEIARDEFERMRVTELTTLAICLATFLKSTSHLDQFFSYLYLIALFGTGCIKRYGDVVTDCTFGSDRRSALDLSTH